PWPFALHWIFLDPLVVALAVRAVAPRLPGLRRRLTTEASRVAAVRAAASATFHEKGVARTRGRTGMLLYVSQLERRGVVLADGGILSAVDATAWADRVGAIERGIALGEDGVAVAARLRSLAELLEKCLPCGADDVNELGDEPCEA